MRNFLIICLLVLAAASVSFSQAITKSATKWDVDSITTTAWKPFTPSPDNAYDYTLVVANDGADYFWVAFADTTNWYDRAKIQAGEVEIWEHCLMKKIWIKGSVDSTKFRIGVH